MNEKRVEPVKEKPMILKPIEELEGFDSGDSDAFVCDLETGVCGPAKKEKETK